jgi:hypothetical protein
MPVMARGHDPVGKLHAAFQQREFPLTTQPQGGQAYYVGDISDELGTVWTCEARMPAKAHQHSSPSAAQACAQAALTDGTWKNDLPPTPA